MSWIAWVESTYYESEPWELGADNSCVFVYETGCYVGEGDPTESIFPIYLDPESEIIPGKNYETFFDEY